MLATIHSPPTTLSLLHCPQLRLNNAIVSDENSPSLFMGEGFGVGAKSQNRRFMSEKYFPSDIKRT